MIVRNKIWPKTASDVASMAFVLIIVPLIYWFELWVVLPELYEPASLPYCLHFLFGNFLMINIAGNFTFTVLCDTSIRNGAKSVKLAAKEGKKDSTGWRFCSSCDALAPPRSWHCPTCEVCILKRDHHCIFTGCCVGHRNHRYFVMFIFHLFVATAYAFFYNNYFIWGKIDFEFPLSIVKMVFPLAMFMFGFDSSINQFYLMLYIVSVVGMCFTGTLCVYHFHLVLTGSVANERAKGNTAYDLGWRRNVAEVLGERWYLTWLLPYVSSKLSHEGISWPTLKSAEHQTSKSR